jgi:hypothetical protein
MSFHPPVCAVLFFAAVSWVSPLCAGEFPLIGRSGVATGAAARPANSTTPEQAYEDGTAAGLRFRTISNDPRLVLTHEGLKAEKWKSLRIHFSKTPVVPGETLEFYFITKKDRQWSEQKSARLPIPAKTGSVELAVDLAELEGWSGTVIGTRLDFGQTAGAEVAVADVHYSDEPAPAAVGTPSDDPILSRIEAERREPQWSGDADEALVLNSEYLVPLGREKPVVLPLSREDRVSPGASAGPVGFAMWWSAAGSSGEVKGGWESALWWLRDLDHVTVRYRVKQVRGNPVMAVRLYEREAGVGLNNDSWVKKLPLAFGSPVESGNSDWRELVLDRNSMTFIRAGEGTPQWDLVNYLTVEFEGRGHDGAEVLVESPRFHLKDGRVVDLWDPARRLTQFDGPEVPQKIAAGRGRFLIGKGGSLLGGEAGRAALLDLKRLIPDLGLAANQGMRYVAEQAEWLKAHDLGVVYQQGGAYGLAEVISADDAWLANPAGVSRGTTPGSFGMVGLMKYYDMSSPAVRNGFARMLARTGQAGVGEFQIIESYWPWTGGFWGWGEGTLQRLRSTLSGLDEGLTWKTTAAGEHLRFWDFFRYHNGFVMTPADVGLTSWAEFYPPRLRGVSEAKDEGQRRHFFLMMNLTRYEALKFYGSVGTAAASAGVRLGAVINRENYDSSFDQLGLVAQKDVATVGHEYFGNPRHYLEHSFEHGGVLRQLMESSGTELRGVLETNATGTTGRPYYDPQVAYATALAVFAADRPHSVENDWLSWDLKQLGVNGSPVERERYADFVIKGMAFAHAKEGGWAAKVPGKSISVLRSRRINDIGAGEGAWTAMLREEAWPRMAFDFTEARFLGKHLENGSVLVGEWSYCTAEDVSWIEAWLDAEPGRTVVLMGYRPGKRPDGANYLATDEAAYTRINSQEGFVRLLGTEVRKETAVSGGRVDLAGWLSGGAAPSMTVQANYRRTAVTESTDLASLNGQTLVSQTTRANGSRVVYLHYDPDAATRGLDRVVLQRIAEAAGISREFASAEGLVARRFDGNDGMLITAFDRDWMDAFRFVYDPLANLRMKWARSGPERSVRLARAEIGVGDIEIVDRLRGGVRTVRGSEDVVLSLGDAGCGAWFLTRDQKAAVRVAKQAEAALPYFGNSFTMPAR